MTGMTGTTTPGLTARLVHEVVVLAAAGLPIALAEQEMERLAQDIPTAAMSSSVSATIAVAHRLGGARSVPLIGRAEHVDVLYGAMLNALIAEQARAIAGTSALSPAAFGAALSLAVDRGADGEAFLKALLVGSEIALRMTVAMDPSLSEAGFDPAGICGVLGAAIAGGLICRLDEQHLASALGTAASSTVGLREDGGTDLASFHAGKAAMNGVLAVLLAEADFQGSVRVLEAPRGLFGVLAPEAKAGDVLSGFGSTWLVGTDRPPDAGELDEASTGVAVRRRAGITELATAGDVSGLFELISLNERDAR
jgi:hypothetical protein